MAINERRTASRPSRSPAARHLLAACIGGLALTACNHDAGRLTQPPAGVPKLDRYVTSAVSGELDLEGRFVMQSAVPPADVAMITRERAGQLAVAMVHTYGQFFERSWERQRGADIDLESLELDPRIHYADTPHERFPDTYHPADRRHFGPFYLVHFTSGGAPVLAVAVSAYNTDVQIEKGRLRLPDRSGGDFFPVAVSVNAASGPTRYVPVSPEVAVEHVASRTGARVSRVPELVMLDRGYHPTMAQWKLTFEQPVHVRRSRGGERTAVREVYVGPSMRLTIPSAAQPDSRRAAYKTGPRSPSGQRAPQGLAHLRTRWGMYTAFDEVTLEAPES